MGLKGIATKAKLTSIKVGSSGGVVDVSQLLAATDWVVQHRNDDPQRVGYRVERRRVDGPHDGRQRLDRYLVGVEDVGGGDLVRRPVGFAVLARPGLDVTHLGGHLLVGHVLVGRQLVDQNLGVIG